MSNNTNKGLNKAELINIIHEHAAQVKGEFLKSKTDCEKALTVVLNALTDGLKKHKKITLIGFGTFAVNERKARTGHNPKTGAKMQIAAYKQPVFKAGKKLKDEVQ